MSDKISKEKLLDLLRPEPSPMTETTNIISENEYELRAGLVCETIDTLAKKILLRDEFLLPHMTVKKVSAERFLVKLANEPIYQTAVGLYTNLKLQQQLEQRKTRQICFEGLPELSQNNEKPSCGASNDLELIKIFSQLF